MALTIAEREYWYQRLRDLGKASLQAFDDENQALFEEIKDKANAQAREKLGLKEELDYLSQLYERQVELQNAIEKVEKHIYLSMKGREPYRTSAMRNDIESSVRSASAPIERKLISQDEVARQRQNIETIIRDSQGAVMLSRNLTQLRDVIRNTLQALNLEDMMDDLLGDVREE